MLIQLKKDLRELVKPGKSELLSSYFKSGKGAYAEGDIFIGVVVPDQRKIALKYKELPLPEVEKLLHSTIHEERLIALFILVLQSKNSGDSQRKEIFDLYLKNTAFVNNWDLVDSSAPHLSGAYLRDKDKRILYKLARSTNLWERRIAMLSTAYFIGHKEYQDALKIAELLLNDKHDLIHKAVGWMLREIGNRDLKIEEEFLDKYYKQMPRTMLRYAIEKFTPERKAQYMAK